MTLEVKDIATLSGDRPADAARVKRGTEATPIVNFVATRGRFLKGAVATGVGLGLASLRLFPLAEPAFADGYDIYPDPTAGPCGPTGDSRFCAAGCGPSTVAGTSCDDGVCGACWHRCCGQLGPNGATHYLRPNECYVNYYDGWLWRCGSGQTYRCHDGWACYNGGCGRTICRVNV